MEEPPIPVDLPIVEPDDSDVDQEHPPTERLYTQPAQQQNDVADGRDCKLLIPEAVVIQKSQPQRRSRRLESR